jgi:ketosteroid isomerase-like protein
MPDNLQVTKAIYDAFAVGQIDAILAIFDPQIEWHSAENFIYSDESPYRGKEAVLTGVFRRLANDWENFSMIPEVIRGSGDLIIANGRMRGKFKATGVVINAQFVQVFQFQDGKLIHCQMYTDTAQFRDAVYQKTAGA